MESKDFEVVENELKEAISKNDRESISSLLNTLLSYDERYINIMPEYIYGRYLRCIDQAKAALT